MAEEYSGKRSEEQWRQDLSPEQNRVLRRKGTERAVSGEHYDRKDKGLYRCSGCGNPLFSSQAKFDSGTGWPSYYQPVSDRAVETAEDRSHGTMRTEVLCARCGGHLGHVFPDGPKPTGLRYCINSVSLDFKPESPGSGGSR